MPRRKRDECRASSPVEKPKTPQKIKRTRVLSPVSPDNHESPALEHELESSIPSHIRRLPKGKYVQSGSGFIDMTCDTDDSGDSSGISDTSIHVRMDVVRFDWPSRFTPAASPRVKITHRGDSTPDRFISRHDDSVLKSTPRSARLARHVELVVDPSGPGFEERLRKAARARPSKQIENIAEESFTRRVRQADRRQSPNPFLRSPSDTVSSTLRQLPHERALLLRSASSLNTPPRVSGPSPSSRFHMQRAPVHVYDAPEILEDYYASPFAWSSNDSFACALGSAVFFSKVSGNRLLNIEQLCSDKGVKSAVEWSGNHLAVGQSDGSLSLYDTTTKQQTSTLLHASSHSSQICALSWTGNLLAAGLDGAALLWDIRQPSQRPASGSSTHHPISKITTHGPHKVCGVKWREDGEMLATSGDDNVVCGWDMRALKKPLIGGPPGKLAWKKRGHCSAVKALAWCPWAPSILASGGGKSDGAVNFWSAQTGTLKHSLPLGSQITSIFFSPVCREIVTTHGFRAPSHSPIASSMDETETANSILTHSYPSLTRLAHVPNLHGMRISHASLSPDGSRLMTGGTFEALVMWSVWGSPARREEKGLGSCIGLIR
ncbi:unnamed protein product [Rhizoctonia solani]|uniref:CDC20/Fizzy WD40 domain-containing protein n=1 Tax=Rhizoctonia solani TaxID=456999 RepID=A0A8H3DXG2_9AGAM|nr:unnamed protein product [Rhizoctonia solani]